MQFVPANNARTVGGFRALFRSRDIFLHDGKTLRRVRVSSAVQFAIAFALTALVLWSAFAAIRLLAGPSGDPAEMARMQRQMQAMRHDVEAMKAVAQQRYQLTTDEVRKLGLEPQRFTGQGGPFEAVEPLTTSPSDPKFKQLFTSWKKLDQLEQGTIAIPSLKPVSSFNFTSGFGVRSDPFRGRAALHPGVDLAGPLGTPVYATADGIVDRAEWNTGGYGNLVEIDHGHGIQTRYGHLSRYVVASGQHVKRGDLIAYMGSTGRSTGSHLHYEVRIDGRAINPMPFLQGSEYLASIQQRVALATPSKVAMGGPEDAN